MGECRRSRKENMICKNLLYRDKPRAKKKPALGARHPEPACHDDRSKAGCHSASCSAELFSRVWRIQAQGKWESPRWRQGAILVTQGCNRPRWCEHLDPYSFLSHAFEHFRNTSSEHPSLSCLKEKMRDRKHDSGIFFRRCAFKSGFLISSPVTFSFSLNSTWKKRLFSGTQYFFMHWLNKSSFLVNSPWVPTAVPLRHRSKAGSSSGAGRGWWVQAPPGKQALLSDAAFGVWDDLSHLKGERILPKDQHRPPARKVQRR